MTTTTTEKPTATDPPDWKSRLGDLWYKTKVADYALQIDKDDRRQRILERLAKKTQDGTLGEATAEPSDAGDDMGVAVGNEIHHHHQQPKAEPASTVAKTLATAGLAAAGLGAGISAPILAYNLTRPDKPAQADTAFVDTDTQYGLRVYRDPE